MGVKIFYKKNRGRDRDRLDSIADAMRVSLSMPPVKPPKDEPEGISGKYGSGVNEVLRGWKPYKEINTVTVRWHDGYMETFRATEVRFGSDLLWMRLEDGTNRHIPLRSVRWFGTSIESHQSTGF